MRMARKLRNKGFEVTRKMSLNYALDLLMYSCRFCS